ncbi:hypothetical protein EG68_05894 [Paragonimus skrjabini miyazakii]|uniref:Uncharacterized protein n=1 Tax=Paragonimus skrjabini miyazakii TaxID=59628 RepID=A0A8S9YQ42_9TREM|nr:hypothetical protein EG68_05894 [Paragonimus skrjabini miyazakii]
MHKIGSRLRVFFFYDTLVRFNLKISVLQNPIIPENM